MNFEIYPVGVGDVDYTAVVKVNRKGLAENSCYNKV